MLEAFVATVSAMVELEQQVPARHGFPDPRLIQQRQVDLLQNE
jgi:hypothetical protein